MIIFLVGYMGSGKTTAGKKLAKAVNVPFLDLDHHFEERYHTTIKQYFEEFGEAEFRKMEVEVLHSLDTTKDMIVSTGGGTPCFYNNMEWMNNSGCTIYLQMPPKAIFNRVKNAKQKRPLLEGKSNPEEFITSHLKEREAFYLRADCIVNGLSLDFENLVKIIQPLFS